MTSDRRAIVSSVLICVLALSACGGTEGKPQGSASGAIANSQSTTSDADVATAGVRVRFAADGPEISVAELLADPVDAENLELSDEWNLGGDFSRIASFPLSSDTVFGSSTSTPDDIASYSASLLHRSGADEVIGRPADLSPSTDAYFEPQDGSATDRWVVWRSSRLEFASPVGSPVDDWVLAAYDLENHRLHVLDRAEGLNGSPNTPRMGGDIVPTTDGVRAYFASAVHSGAAWRRMVLAYPLEGGERKIVGEGDYPAPVTDGVIFARPHEGDDSLTEVVQWHADTGIAEPLFSISSVNDAWVVGGLWANHEWRVVAIVDSEVTKSAWIGIWGADQDRPSAWLRSPSSTVAGSLGASRFAWGAGSQANDAGMFVADLQTGDLQSLGSAPGYSRPVLSSTGETILVPGSDGISAVSWKVARISQ